MKKLYDLVTLEENNYNCVILKVKDGSQMDLIRLGCFNGNEIMFRVTKGNKNTYTVFKNNGENYSWDCGRFGCTLVADNISKQRWEIFKCVQEDFGIKVE